MKSEITIQSNKMKTNSQYKQVAIIAALLLLMIMTSYITMAQPPPGPPPPPPPGNPPAGAPIDGGVVTLIGACLAYGYYKFKK